jgi:hypothetical protein
MRHLRQGVPGQCLRPVPDAAPVIARQNDLLDLLFLCEIYCPTGALYVATIPRGRPGSAKPRSRRRDCSGSYARGLGWRRGKPGGADKDPTFRLRATDI